MSYDENQPSARPRRVGRGNLTIAIAALVPTALAGWLVWRAMSGPEDNEPPKVLPLPSRQTAGKPGPAPSPSPPASSPAATSAPSPSKGNVSGPLAGKVVVVDPGHNPGNFRHTSEINELVDIGTNRKECDTTGTATNDGYTEAEFTFDVSQRLRALLEKQGATVKFTHANDRPFGPCVDERARVGNKAGAAAVVSVHADGSAVGNRGFHVILPALVKGGAADTAKIVGPSRDLGERIAGKFVRATGSAPSNYVGGGTGLDVRKDLGGLNLSTVPKVFIECGNMRDPKDAALLKSSSWREKAAQGIADGIGSYLLR
ncbi:N-acetylmuramoyl-L-alanine amidase [Streptomyces sp. ISL-1]|uniref:N-acetylmuramoyl-L-alanine amidase n=1 Tax=Streptomyces sp. ISL-1 TaxID=2817657 RepID=UPI0027E4AFFC|nr:N-acetylmuramoyl-L-alanine amidase [Streptomyces sp. ISL-1]